MLATTRWSTMIWSNSIWSPKSVTHFQLRIWRRALLALRITGCVKPYSSHDAHRAIPIMSQTTVSSRWPKIGLPPRPFKTWLEFYKYVLPPPGPGHTGVHRYYYAYLDDYNLWESTTTEGAPPDVRTYDFNLDEEHAGIFVYIHLYFVLFRTVARYTFICLQLY